MEKMITSEEFYNNRIKLMKKESLFEKLINTDSQDFIKSAIEPHNVQLINFMDTKKELDTNLKICCMPELKLSSSQTNNKELFEIKPTEIKSLNLKEQPEETFKSIKHLKKQSI